MHHTKKSTVEETRDFDLKSLGATPTVRVVVYTALGIAAVAETTFWCSWFWSKDFKEIGHDGREPS